jgi:hypothetical protein
MSFIVLSFAIFNQGYTNIIAVYLLRNIVSSWEGESLPVPNSISIAHQVTTSLYTSTFVTSEAPL